jgi:hypothetical protein
MRRCCAKIGNYYRVLEGELHRLRLGVLCVQTTAEGFSDVHVMMLVEGRGEAGTGEPVLLILNYFAGL